jgi:Phosphodiester glycosidase
MAGRFVPMKFRTQRPSVLWMCILWLVLMMGAGGYASVVLRPSVGAWGAEVLRGWFGDSAVAWLESAVFQIHDLVQQWEYQMGARPDAPWAAFPIPSPSALPSQTPNVSLLPAATQEGIPPATASPGAVTPASTTVPIRWPPAAIPGIGRLPGEGDWTPFISDASGKTVAYRTFLQPDPSRPYTISAIVAVDLNETRLHYVLGFTEPLSKVQVERTGIIPKQDRKTGILLAVFNGGFLTRHGLFGVMVDGRILMPMREDLGTLAIYPDGRVTIGVWGSDITSCEGFSVVRQNGPMMVHDGRINPKTRENLPEYWGQTVHGDVATWRSAVGISADGKTLYYAAGWSLTISALAQALKTAGAYGAIQLDINYYWVLFATIQFNRDVPRALPLLTEMKDNVDRYLYASARDYFYLTSAAG